MTKGQRDYGLSWVDQDALYETIENCFSRVLGLTSSGNDLPPDPFTIVSQAIVTNTTLQANLGFEVQRKVNKTLSNVTGNMHQDILGLAENWRSLGRSGGYLDIRTVEGYRHPTFGKAVVAEVKNRFNTIKASDEPAMWDKIKSAAQLSEAQGYLFQITPKTPERYDRMWTPSHRTEDPMVRVCDGATAYEIVFGHASALKELYMALPRILRDIQHDNGLAAAGPMPSMNHMEELYHSVYPD